MNRKQLALGFTLVEMMVALLVLGLLSGVMASGLFLSIRSWEGIERQQNQQNEVFSLQHALRNVVGNIRGEFIRDTDGVRQVAVYGTDREIIFVAPLKQLRRSTELFWIRLAVDEDTEHGQQQLIVAYQPYTPVIDYNPNRKISLSSGNLDWDELRVEMMEAANTEVVYEGDLADFRIEYLKSEQGQRPSWDAEWQEQPRLPALVKIAFGGTEPPWPDLMIRPKVEAYVFKSLQ